jgi:hypothetical protein
MYYKTQHICKHVTLLPSLELAYPIYSKRTRQGFESIIGQDSYTDKRFVVLFIPVSPSKQIYMGVSEDFLLGNVGYCLRFFSLFLALWDS